MSKGFKWIKRNICLASKFKPEEWDKNCPIILSDVCDKFYAEPTKYFPNCKNEEILQVFVTSKAVMEYLKSNTHFVCSTDESGKVCPAAEASRNSKRWSENDILNTCQSKKCTDEFSDMLTTLLKNMDTLVSEGIFQTKGDVETTFGGINDNLKSETCTSKHGNASSGGLDTSSGDPSASPSGSGASSGDISVISKISSTLLVVITLILAYFNY